MWIILKLRLFEKVQRKKNECKRLDIKLVSKWEVRYDAEALIAKPNFHSRAIFVENLVAVQLNRTEITFRKPVYVCLGVLEISKEYMYRFHYEFMKKHLYDDCKLLYMDTYSFIYLIRNHNIYELMKNHIDEFDTSDYNADNQYGIPLANKKQTRGTPGVSGGEASFLLRNRILYNFLIKNDEILK